MRYKIVGDNLQMVIMELDPGEKIYAEAGALNHMSANVRMDTKIKGGFLKGIKRILTGESLFLTEFSAQDEKGVVAFAGNVPGKIIPVKVEGERELIVQKDAFLAAEEGVDLDIVFVKRIGAGLFGGEGFILEKLSGEGLVFLHACGDLVEYELEPKQVLKVDTGHIVGFDATVDYDIALVKGIKSMLFGGEGIFLAKLTGPGKVMIQSMTARNLAAALSPFLTGKSSGRGGIQLNFGI
ncbi:TIGR00266 family protein [Candidatus Geothermarchaeota archaeon]|nr:MAG: TIGR00266 family protein [Candidatus Geothermarchaeota archaeon]